MSSLHLFLLGSPEVRLGSSLVKFPTRKALALLTYLALEPGQHPREQLAALFWPEARSERSYGSLRNTFSRLQIALRNAGDQSPSPYLSSTHQTLAFDPQPEFSLDLTLIEQAYALARADRSSREAVDGLASLPALEAAVASQRGDFLAGFSLGDAPGFDDWVGMQREAWRRRLSLILDRLSEIQYAQGDLAHAAETASRWIALDGLNEVAYRRKMRAHFAAGERGQALDTYEVCRATLEAELKVEPEPDTQRLADRIRAPRHPVRVPEAQRPSTETAVAFLESLFAGREAEQQLLQERYRLAVAGRPQVGVLRGEAGIGKTRLAGAFLAQAAVEGALTLQGGAFESGTHIPFQPWVEALRNELDRDGHTRERLSGPWLSALRQLVPELSDGVVDGSGALEPADPESEAALDGDVRLFEALAHHTLAQSVRAPLVIFLDDLQWADTATLDALQYCIRRWRAGAARILLLVGIRTEALASETPSQQPNLNSWLSQLVQDAEACQLELKPLSERDTVQLVASLLAAPAPDFAQWLFNETQGHPFYLMETLKDLLERSALHVRRGAQGQWVFAVDQAHDLGRAVRVPSTVRFVIRSRLNRLSPNAFTLLAAGTVLDHGLTFERLCAVANLTLDAGLPALDEVLSARLLREVWQPGLASVYAFANDMCRDVVYTEAGDARRRLFHRRALDVLEAEHGSPAVLAHHALAAGVAGSAMEHSLAAAQEALRVSAPGEARAHLDNARRLARDAAIAVAEIEARLRELYGLLGQNLERIDEREQAGDVDLARGRVPSSRPRSPQ